MTANRSSPDKLPETHLAPLSPSPFQPPPPKLTPEGMKIRPATAADVPAVARLVLAALAAEPPWRALCAGGRVEAGEQLLRRYLDGGNGRHRVLVVELSAAEAGPRAGGPLVVSAAVWDTSACRSATHGDGPADRVHDDRRGMWARARARGGRQLTRDTGSGPPCAKLPDDLAALVGRARLTGAARGLPAAGRGPPPHLNVLATRPDHQRRGYARALASWGTRLAREARRPLCALAAPRAYILLSGLGDAT